MQCQPYLSTSEPSHSPSLATQHTSHGQCRLRPLIFQVALCNIFRAGCFLIVFTCSRLFHSSVTLNVFSSLNATMIHFLSHNLFYSMFANDLDMEEKRTFLGIGNLWRLFFVFPILFFGSSSQRPHRTARNACNVPLCHFGLLFAKLNDIFCSSIKGPFQYSLHTCDVPFKGQAMQVPNPIFTAIFS